MRFLQRNERVDMKRSEIRRECKRFIKENSLSQINLKSLEEALERSGYTLVEYSRFSPDADVSALVTALGLEKQIETSRGFAYAKGDYRLVFLCADLADSEKLLVLAHETGHIVLGHMETPNMIGLDVKQEYEANVFAQTLIDRPLDIKIGCFLQKKGRYIIGGILLLAGILCIVFALHILRENDTKQLINSESQTIESRENISSDLITDAPETITQEPATQEPEVTTQEPVQEETDTQEVASIETDTEEPASEEPVTEAPTPAVPETTEPTAPEPVITEPTIPEPITPESTTPEPVTEPAACRGILAYYTGPEKTAGESISASDLTVSGVFSDGTVKPIEGWICEMVGKPLAEGGNDLTVVYDAFSITVSVNAKPRTHWEGEIADNPNVKWVLDESGTLTFSGRGSLATTETISVHDERILRAPGATVWGGTDTFDEPLWRNDFPADKVKRVVIENGITDVPESAFAMMNYLESVSLPDGLTGIGRTAFCRCVRLTQIDVPGSVKSIGEAAFHLCVNLRKVTLREGLERIEDEAFGACGWTSYRYYMEVRIPESVKYIGNRAFSDNPGFHLYLPHDPDTLGDITASSVLAGECTANSSCDDVIILRSFDEIDWSTVTTDTIWIHAYPESRSWDMAVNIREKNEYAYIEDGVCKPLCHYFDGFGGTYYKNADAALGQMSFIYMNIVERTD